jgi:hypothetical protein
MLCPPSIAVSKIVQYLKGRSSRLKNTGSKVLGAAPVVTGVLLRDSRKRNERNDTGIYSEPV